MLYTKKGDTGTTTLYGCNQKMSKSSAIAEALGALDEANSFLGLCRTDADTHTITHVVVKDKKRPIRHILKGVQETLFIVQAHIAGADKNVSKAKVDTLEQIIGDIEKTLPPIKGFTVVGGSQQSAQLDVARTIVRRAERRVVAVHDEGTQKVGKHVLAYMNRLSSLLFALARYVNHEARVQEECPTYE